MADEGGLPTPKLARPFTEPPHRGRVLVVAPHPDDESFGPGATLALHARLGDPVHLVFVTTGVHGDHRGDADPAAYVAMRQDEARAAAAALGIDAASIEFWGFPDGCVVTPQDLEHVVGMLADLFARTTPDVVYAPHLGESHSDHHFVAKATELARVRAGSAARHLGFEVWTPLVADVVVDVTDVYPAKLAAMRSYPSQIAEIDLVGAIDALNHYRTILLPPGTANADKRAEVFLEVA